MIPKISVVMLSYNTGQYIKEAVESILSQSFTDFELIILDDCSTDNTDEVIASIQDTRLHYHKAEKNQGIPYMRNLGLDLSQGKYIAILDSDDLAPPYRLQDQFEYMESHPDVGVLSGDFFSFGVKCRYHKAHQGSKNIQYRFLFRCPIANPAAMVRRSVLEQYQVRYDTTYPVCTDYKFWITLLNRTEFANLGNKPYLFYRTSHKESITADTMGVDKIKNRDDIVNEMRYDLFERFGLYMCKEDYRIFSKFYCYEKYACSKEEYAKLHVIMEDLIAQGKKVLKHNDIWEEQLNDWLKLGKKIICEE